MLDYLNINDIDLSNLRKNIGYVSQDTFLFADTIKIIYYMVVIKIKANMILLKLVV